MGFRATKTTWACLASLACDLCFRRRKLTEIFNTFTDNLRQKDTDHREVNKARFIVALCCGLYSIYKKNYANVRWEFFMSKAYVFELRLEQRNFSAAVASSLLSYIAKYILLKLNQKESMSILYLIIQCITRRKIEGR